MATISKWSPFGVALDITATAGAVTRVTPGNKVTVAINVRWGVSWDGAQTDYGMDVTSGGVTKTISTEGTKRSSGTGSFTGTYTVNTNGATTISVPVVFKNYNTWAKKSATKTITLTVSVPEWTKYTVKYNLNGGTGTFANQTKWKDQPLKLHTSSPTKTGHSFYGWRALNGVLYQPSASYTANSATTLTAEWKPNTYTVKYNANGGTGEPAQQTKTYGVTLKLSTTVPTRKNYNFKGWATSASATTAQYAAGGQYTGNTNVYLYAVWELAYAKPRIDNFIVTRGDSNPETGEWVSSDNGTTALVQFEWSTFLEVSSITISCDKLDPVTVSASGTSGTVEQLFGSGSLSTDSTYSVKVTVADGDGDAYRSSLTRTLPGAKFVIDFLKGGTGVAVGKPAEDADYFDVGYKTHLRESLLVDNQKAFYGYDPEGNMVEFMNPMNENGNIVLGYGNYDRGAGNTNVYGHDVHIGVSNIPNKGYYRPYRRAGDSITLSLKTAGYVTNGGKDVSFTVPLAVPIIGKPTVSASSVDGFALRQDSKYTHGSSASVCVSPDSYSATIHNDSMWVGVTIVASFTDTTNVTNNDAIGIYWSGTITFT